MKWIEIPLAEIKIDSDVQCLAIEYLQIDSKVNSYACAEVVLSLVDALENADSLKDSAVLLSHEGKPLFSGKCVSAQVEQQGGYYVVRMTLASNMVKADEKPQNRTYQNPSTTLDTIAACLKEYGLSYFLENNMAIGKVLSQKNETDFQYVTNISNEKKLCTFDMYDDVAGNLYIGNKGYKYEEIGEQAVWLESGKCLSDMRYDMANGASPMAEFEYKSTRLISNNIHLIAGCKTNLGIVMESHLYSARGVIKNEVIITEAETATPPLLEQRKEAFSSNILTGSISKVDATTVQVLFDTDEGGGMTDIPYESVLSNSMYVMPEESDNAFVYVDNQGTLVCLGSKRIDMSDAFFQKNEKSFGSYDSVLYFPDSNVVISATREKYSLDEDENQVTIKILKEEGIISFKAKRDLKIQSDERIVIGSAEQANLKDSVDHILETKNHNLSDNATQKAEESKKYVPVTTTPHYDLSDYFTSEGFSLRAASTWDDVKTSFVEGGKGMIFWDWWHQDDPLELNYELSEFESGSILLGAQSLQFSVGNVCLQVGRVHTATIDLYAAKLSWFGTAPTTNYPIKQDELRDAWEIFMDVVVTGLAIAATCVAIFCTGGAALIAGVAIGLVAAAVAFARDDYFGAFTSLVGAVLSGVAGLAKAGSTLAKFLEGTKKLNAWLQLVYGLAQTFYVLPKSWKTTWARINAQDTWYGKTAEFVVGFLGMGSQIFSNAGNAKSLYDAYHPQTPANGNTPPADDQTTPHDSPDPVDSPETTTGTHDGDPVNVATGALCEDHTDLRLKDINGDFRLVRSYKSTRSNKNRMLGSRWIFNIESCLWFGETDNQCTVHLSDDHNEKFIKNSNGLWENEIKGKDRYILSETEDGFSMVDMNTHYSYFYSATGFIQYFCDSYGNRTRYEYDGKLIKKLTLESGQSLEFYYTGNKLTAMEDNNGRKYEYTYAADLLETVKYPNGGIIRYEYTDEGFLYRIHNENGKVYLNNHYDKQGRVVFQTTADGEEYTFFYNDREKETVVTKSGLNRTVRYKYNSRDLVEKTSYEDGTTFERTYDANDKVIVEKNRLGHIIERKYNSYGLITQEILPNGKIRYFEYNENGKCIREYDNAGVDKKFTYDEHGALVKANWKIDEKTSASYEYKYDQAGRMVEKIYPDSASEMWEYDTAFVHPSLYRNAEQIELRYELDGQGRRTAVTHDAGSVQYAYNSNNHLTMVEDEEHNVTRYTYDLTELRTDTKSPEDNVAADGKGTHYKYDEMDHLLEIEDASGILFRRVVDSEGKILKEYDPVLSSKRDEEELGITYKYDVNGYRTHVIYQDGSIKRSFYDAVGNLLKVVEPEEYDEKADDGLGRTFTYDAMNRVLTERDLHGKLVAGYTYDLSGNIVSVTNEKYTEISQRLGKKVAAKYSYNNVGWRTEERIPVKEEQGKVLYRVRTFTYDLRGHVTCEKRYLDYQEEGENKGRILQINKKYDRLGRMLQVSDSLGAVVEYAYNERNQVALEKSKVSEKVYAEKQYAYSPNGHLSSMAVKMGSSKLQKEKAITTFEYNHNGLLARLVSPTGHVLSIDHDRSNRTITEHIVQRDGKMQSKTDYLYNDKGRLEQRLMNGKSMTYGYDIRGRQTTVKNFVGKTTAWLYDKNGRIVKRIQPKQYDIDGENAKGTIVSYTNGKATSICDELTGSLQEFTYNDFGENTSIKTSAMHIEKEYDLGGRCISVKSSFGLASQQKEFDPWNHETKVIDGNGNTTSFELDEWGRVEKVLRADGGIESYEYNYAGSVSKIVDGLGHVTQFEYDERNLLAKRTDQLGFFETWNYDEEGRTSLYRDRNGNEIAYSYNMFDQLTAKKAVGEVGKEEIYSYTETGLLDFCIGGGMRYDYCYDEFNRLVAKKASGRTLIQYGYNDYDEMISRSDISGKTTEYSYDASGRLDRVIDDGVEQIRYLYDAEGRLLQKNSGALQSVFSYDGDGNVRTLKTSLLDDILMDNTYRYDGNGNLTNVQKKDQSVSFAYDSMNRIVAALYPDHVDRYAYDYADNRVSKMHFDEVGRNLMSEEEWILPQIDDIIASKPECKAGYNEIYHYDDANRLTERVVSSLWDDGAQDTYEYKYDNNGNMLSDGENTYQYDAFNRTIEIHKNDGNYIRNTYDAEGLRAELEENGKLIRFIYSGNEVVVEENEEEKFLRYVRGLGLICSDSESARTYYHYVSDEKGSTTHVVNAGVGKKQPKSISEEENVDSSNDIGVLNQYEYDEFGNLLISEESVPNRFKYTGEIYDAVIGQYYLRARFYNPVLGRFNQEDDRYDDGLNLWAYCKNNPVKYADPTGHSTTSGPDRPVDVDTDEYSYLNGDGAFDPVEEGAILDPNDTSDLIPPQSSNNEPMTWNEFQHANKGKYTKQQMSEAWAAYKLENGIGTGNTSTTGSHGNSLSDPRTNYGYVLVDKNTGEILKYGETIHPDTRYTQGYLQDNNAVMVILDSGSKEYIHNWQHDLNEYYKAKYGSYPPLNSRGW